ncbi:unnamed protein product [Tilletia laevis]|uniref:Tyr recombinase domain-containing protein n=1 Tax=Tilletia laevis TaxID=157183 RepID=A0A9N8LJ70_9BASI|nr:unnamed protein product [Tilletia laevis]CAD6931863.1 unnamed protein product [Tilletia laevis]
MWPEAVGADLGVRHLIANGVRDRRVRLYNDNTAVKSGIRHGRVRNEAANHCLERLFWFASDRNITSFLLASLLPITPPTVPSEAFLLPSLGFPFYLSPLSSPQSSPASGDRTTAIAAALLTAEYRSSSSSRRSVLSSPTPPSTRRASSSTAALNRRQFRPRPAPVPSSLAALAASRQLSTGGLPAVGSGAAVRGSRDERLARVMEMAFAPSTRIGYAYGTGLSHFLSCLSLALRGATVMTPASSERPPRDPYTPAYLRAIKPHFDLRDAKDLTVWCAFWGLERIREVTVPTQKTYDPAVHISRAGWALRPPSPGSTAAGTLRLPWTKTTRSAGAVVVLSAQDVDLCPVLALSAPLTTSALPDSLALFAYFQGNKRVPLSRSVFLSRLRRAAEAAALPALHGHSFRIGGCAKLLLRGAAIEDVKAHGRWRSNAWTVYVRDHAGVFSDRLSVAPLVHAHLGA